MAPDIPTKYSIKTPVLQMQRPAHYTSHPIPKCHFSNQHAHITMQAVIDKQGGSTKYYVRKVSASVMLGFI
jgi:hypothetical protein